MDIPNNQNNSIYVPKFIREHSFYNGNIFARYVEKIRVKMFDFLSKECVEFPETYGTEYFNEILIAALFHQLRIRDNFENIQCLSQLVYGTQYESEGLFGLCVKTVDMVYQNTIDEIKNKYDVSLIEQVSCSSADTGVNSMADFEVGKKFSGFMQMLINKEENTTQYTFDLYNITNHSFISACKLFLEGKVIFNKLHKEQINTKALPETNEELYGIYNSALVILQNNFLAAVNNVSLDSYMSKISSEERTAYKEEISSLKKEIVQINNAVKQVEIESKKKTDEEIKNIVKTDNEKIIENLRAEMLSLKKQVNRLTAERDALENTNMRLTSEVEVANNHIKNLKNHINEETLECDYSKKYGFVSQHETLNSKILKAFPNSIIIDKSISSKKINVDAIVGITKEISHSLYAETKNYAISNNIPYIHCCEINPGKIAECIAANLI